jgi:hypothetical protein
VFDSQFATQDETYIIHVGEKAKGVLPCSKLCIMRKIESRRDRL